MITLLNEKFVKSPRVNEPDRICSYDTEASIVDEAFGQNNYDDINLVFKVATTIRKELLESQSWKFEGSFSNFTVPKALSTLLKWILIGPSVELSETSENTELNKMISVISQVLMQAVKTKRQVQYNPKDGSDGSTYNTKETPLSVGLGLFLHQRTRSKEIVDMLSTLNLSCTYKKVLSIKESIVKEVTEQMENNNSVYVPSSISPNNRLYFAIDNTDVQVDTPDGRGQLHGTAQVIYQQKDCDYVAPLTTILRKSKQAKNNQGTNNSIYDINICSASAIENASYPDFSGINSLEELTLHNRYDITWATLTCFNHESAKDVPTWAAFNSVRNTDNISLTNYCTIPLLHGSPTDWSNLYTALKISQNINGLNSRWSQNNYILGSSTVYKMHPTAIKR